MKYADIQLLRRWALLQLEIAKAKNPTAIIDITPSTVTRSAGYKKLRAWFLRQGPAGKVRARAWMESQIVGVREILKRAKESGESLDLGDIEIEYKEVPDDQVTDGDRNGDGRDDGA